MKKLLVLFIILKMSITLLHAQQIVTTRAWTDEDNIPVDDGENDTNTVRNISTISTCTTIAIPLFENFDNTSTGGSTSPNAPDHWSFLMNNTSAYVYTSNPYSSPNCYCLYSSAPSTELNTLLISPYFTDPINTLRTRFMAKASSIGCILKVGYMTDSTDMSTLIIQDSIIFSVSSWMQYKVSFASCPHSSGNHIAFVLGQRSSAQTIYLDDIHIEYIPECRDIDSIRITNIGATSITADWTGIPDATSYEIQYKTATDSVWLSSFSSNTNSYYLTGLSPQISYQIRIRSVCGTSGDGIWSMPISFTTSCLPTAIPIFENFDNTNTGTIFSPNAPNCWSYLKNSGNSYAYVNSGEYYSSPNGYRLYCSNTLTGPSTSLISPYFTDSIRTLRTRFMAKPGAMGYVLKIGYMTNPADISTLVIQDSIVFSTLLWTQYKILFNTVHSNGNYIAFVHGERGSNQSIYLDNIHIEPIPNCPDIDNVEVSNITQNSVALTFFSVATVFNAQYRVAGSQTWSSPDLISGSTTVIGNLIPHTYYEFRIQSICGADSGLWTNPIMVRTKQEPAIVPFVENFETSTASQWTSINGSQPNKWHIDTAVYGGEHGYSAYISNDNGVSNIYTISSSNITHIYRDIQFPEGTDFKLYFDWRAQGEKIDVDYDYLRISLIDTSRVPTAGIALPISDTLAGYRNLNSTWRRDTVSISDNIAGQIKRLVFSWINNASGGNQAPAAIDNLTVTTNQIIPPSCNPVTTLQVSTLGTDIHTTWTTPAGQNKWLVYYIKDGIDSSSVIVEGTTSYTFDGLTRGSIYTISVRNICGNNDTSIAVTSYPVAINNCDTVEEVGIHPYVTSSFVNWTAPVGQNKWEWICTPLVEGASLSNIVNQTTDTIRGLEPGAFYSFQIRSICNPGDTGEFTLAKIFQSNSCPIVENLTVLSIEPGDSIFASWLNNEYHQSWEISVVPQGSPREAPIVVNTFQGTYIKVDNPNLNYDVYARGNCGEGEYGEWVMATSYKSNIPKSNAPLIKISLTPNPASECVKLSIEGISGEIGMILLTQEGKILRKEKFLCQQKVYKDIALQGLAKGTYIIHLIHKNWTKVEKLIVQ